ncbi:sulfotransferase family protein [Actinoallomurus acaciae]|uniref:Sulfotransferase n=1 Tax=Actinoallomurus acaciae TaxID=502577 RepID=A0ABV5YAU4_9ACTN
MASHRPIFILGCPRSGGTLLRRMLCAHPRIAIPPETRLLLDAYEHRSAYGDLRRLPNRQALAEWIVAGAGTRFDGLGLDPRTVAEEIVNGPPTLGSALEIAWRAYARRLGKPRWGDKRPGYVQHIDALLRLFPEAQIVHVIRDGRECVAELKSTSWWRMGIYHAIATWTQAIDAGRAAAKHLPASTYTEIQYEHLITDQETELRRLCKFLTEEYTPEMTSEQPKNKKPHLEPWEQELCEAVMTERLLTYGYEPKQKPRPATKHLAHYAAITTHRRLAAKKRTILDSRTQDPTPIATHLT